MSLVTTVVMASAVAILSCNRLSAVTVQQKQVLVNGTEQSGDIAVSETNVDSSDDGEGPGNSTTENYYYYNDNAQPGYEYYVPGANFYYAPGEWGGWGGWYGGWRDGNGWHHHDDYHHHNGEHHHPNNHPENRPNHRPDNHPENHHGEHHGGGHRGGGRR